MVELGRATDRNCSNALGKPLPLDQAGAAKGAAASTPTV